MTEFKHEDALSEITINTHQPSKWRFVDLENGDIWKWCPGWKRTSWEEIEQLGLITRA